MDGFIRCWFLVMGNISGKNLHKKSYTPFLTTDRDFFHTIPHLHQKHAGIIVIALKQPNRHAILQKLSWILNRLKPPDFENRSIQLRDQSWIAVPPLDPPS
jgi:hypothetical protein